MSRNSFQLYELAQNREDMRSRSQETIQITYDIMQMVGWRACILIVGNFLPLLFPIWMSTSALAARQLTKQHVHGAVAIIPQVTATVDPTVTVLDKEKLELDNAWLWNFGTTLLSTLALVVAGVFEFVRWFRDRRAEIEKQKETEKHLLEECRVEREKRDEERFQTIVAGLESANSAARVGATILLSTFLQPSYEQFYKQVFDLDVVFLRLWHVDSEALDSLSQALITVFQELFPKARDYLKQSPQVLDATFVQLNNALLKDVDLQNIWMPEPYHRKAYIRRINLPGAELLDTNFFNASFHGANLSEASLFHASCHWARLIGANLCEAEPTQADLIGANLTGSDPSEAVLSVENLSNAKVTHEQFKKAKSLAGVTMYDGSTPHGTFTEPGY